MREQRENNIFLNNCNPYVRKKNTKTAAKKIIKIYIKKMFTMEKESAAKLERNKRTRGEEGI